MSIKMAFNPLPFYLTTNGWEPELAPPLESILATTKRAGYDAIHAEVPVGSTASDYAALLSAYQLVPAPGYFQGHFDDVSQIEAIIERARIAAGQHAELGLAHIFLASQSGIPARVARPGVGADASEERLARTISGLAKVAAAMKAEGVLPCLHPHIGTWIETMDEADAVLSAIPSSDLLLGPDTGHIAWAGADPAAFIRKHAGRIGAVHIKDVRKSVIAETRAENLTYRQAGAKHIWTEPGRGDIDFDDVFDALVGFDGWFVLEVDIADQPTVEDTARISAQWLRARLEARH